jgi:hypothetical protein
MKVNKGSIETFVVEIVDTVNNLTALPAGTTYDILDTDGNNVSINQAATVEEMRAYCLIDSTLAQMPVGDYDLFLKFSSAPEVPRLGPHRFRVV